MTINYDNTRHQSCSRLTVLSVVHHGLAAVSVLLLLALVSLLLLLRHCPRGLEMQKRALVQRHLQFTLRGIELHFEGRGVQDQHMLLLGEGEGAVRSSIHSMQTSKVSELLLFSQ